MIDDYVLEEWAGIDDKGEGGKQKTSMKIIFILQG